MHNEQRIQSGTGTVIDVRSRGEFSGGHAAGSVNIPLQELPERLEELHKMQQPFILCCASGARSGQAHHFLSGNEFECYNAGSWMDVNFLQNNPH